VLLGVREILGKGQEVKRLPCSFDIGPRPLVRVAGTVNEEQTHCSVEAQDSA
jgi:hypothetical protein